MTQKITPKPVTVHTLDAAALPLGRLATRAAVLLRGKHKPTFTPHLDQGDAVTVINAARVVLTGRKRENKRYYRHSGHPGHLKETSPAELLQKKPTEVVRLAITGMLPKNRLRALMLKRLTILPEGEGATNGR